MSYELPPLPNTIKDERVKQLLAKYYEISNNSVTHDECADSFTSQGEYIINAKKSQRAHGKHSVAQSLTVRPYSTYLTYMHPPTTEIKDFRNAIFSHIPGRDHWPITIYTYGDDQYSLMVHGHVTYDHHHGHQTLGGLV